MALITLVGGLGLQTLLLSTCVESQRTVVVSDDGFISYFNELPQPSPILSFALKMLRVAMEPL